MNRDATGGLAALPLMLVSVLGTAGCQTPDPTQELEVVAFEAYWIVDSSSGSRTRIVPMARVEVRNLRDTESHAIQATASFKVDDPEHADKEWSAWERVAGETRLAPDEKTTVLLRSDGGYTWGGPPEAFFEVEEFSDVSVDVFFRVGSSGWVKLASGPVARRLGSETVVLGPP